MNKKLILKNDKGETVYCVLNGEADETEELLRVFSIEKGYGLTVEKWSDAVKIVNYFRADTVASFPVVSFEDTEEEPLYQLTPLDEN